METQLELNFDGKSEDEMALFLMQKQINEMSDSMGKVRRRLFSELGEVKKVLADLKRENESLREMLKELSHENTEWTYGHGDNLFDVRQYKEA